jgi:hypothetical protein
MEYWRVSWRKPCRQTADIVNWNWNCTFFTHKEYIHASIDRYIQTARKTKKRDVQASTRNKYTRFAFCIRFTSTLQPFQYCNKHMVSFPLTYLTSFLQWHPDRIVMRIVCAAADSLSVSRHFYPRTLTLLFIFGNFQRNINFSSCSPKFSSHEIFSQTEKSERWKAKSKYSGKNRSTSSFLQMTLALQRLHPTYNS